MEALLKHSARIGQLQQVLQYRGLAGAILFYSRDIFYYTGTAQPAYLVVLPHEHRLFVRRGFEFARRECGLEAERMEAESSIHRICQEMFPGPGAGEKVGTELDLFPVAQSRILSSALGERELVDVSSDILEQRMIKDPEEIESIRKACAVVHAGHLAAVACLKAGMSELELAAHVENAQRLAGHEGIFFMRQPDFVMSRGPVASGPNLRRTSGTIYTITGVGLGSAVPAGPSQRRMEQGDLVMVDIPACVDGYHADQSRMYAVGRIAQEALDLFHRLREVSDFLIEAISPGMTTGEAFALTEARASELGLGQAFMGFESQANAHFVGHGIGLEVNEPPLISRDGDVRLRPGMVLAVEMHVMVPGGLTVKLEDTVHLTHEGVQILTLSPRELISVRPLQ
ncbi:MAG: aminopeptidase P family protein [Anaerolineaceae bacterium]|nr:MAG: aminopeptidase P family protein [Anaerolineaceae bacterium]